MSGDSSEWYTPLGIFDALDLRFDLDPAAAPEGKGHVPAESFIRLPEDGLLAEWHGLVWLNPPYGRRIVPWVDRMIQHGEGVLLVPVRTDTRWWHSALVAADIACFIRGRVRFDPGEERRLGQRSPTDRPGASNVLFGFGRQSNDAIVQSELGAMVRCF